MIHSAAARVKAVVRTQHDAPRQIQFAFRADPLALDEMRLPRTARAVFALVLDNARLRGGRCRLSNATMARILGCCTMTIKRALATLEGARLVRRETAAEGRIRTGIVVTWDGVGTCSTERMALEHPRSRGGTSPFQGVEHRCSTNQSPIQSEISDADRSSLGGEEDDPASRVASGPEAAAYLRACIEAGRKGLQPPPPPVPAKAVQAAQAVQDEPTPPALPKAAPVADRPATAKPAASTTTSHRLEAAPVPRTAVPPPSTTPAVRTYPPAPYVPADQVAATVARMTRGLAEGLKAEDVGRRRVGPKKLAAQLAEVRRRHGGGSAR